MNSDKIIAENVGIDIAKKTFVACLSYLLLDRTIRVCVLKEFSNTLTGFKELLQWTSKHRQLETPLLFTLEATGVYHENLAYYLHQQKQEVAIVLANQAKKYKESFPESSKTDFLDARSLASVGLERKLKLWVPTSDFYQELKALTRERSCLIKEKTGLSNRMEAINHSAKINQLQKKLKKERLVLIKKQLQILNRAIKEHLTFKASKEEKNTGEFSPERNEKRVIAQKVKKILTIPGVGYIVVATLLAETDGFARINNIRQLVAYAGLNIKLSKSGTTIDGSELSKRGNRQIKSVLFFPAYSAKNHYEEIQSYYERVVKKQGSGKVGAIAVARKILKLTYTLWKNGMEYDPNFAKTGATSAPI